MASDRKNTPPLKRAGTMDVTALEGSILLTQKGTTVEETADHLRSGHVFKTPDKKSEEHEIDGHEGGTPKRGQLHRSTTIQATIKDSKQIIGESGLGRTRANDSSPKAEEKDEGDGTPSRAPLHRTPTMTATIEDAKGILGKEERGRTRGKDVATHKPEDDKDGSERRAPLMRTQTMAATLEDAKEILGEHDLGRTRGQDSVAETPPADEKDGIPKRPPLQRTSTIAATVKDAERILGQGNIDGTRTAGAHATAAGTSHSIPDESKKTVTISKTVESVEETDQGTLKRTHTIVETIEEGEKLLKRKKI